MRLTFIVLTVLVATVAAGPAHAHQPTPVPVPTVAVDAAPVTTETLQTLVAGAAVPGVDVLALLALALGLFAAVWLPRVPRRAFALVLIVGLSIVAFEAGVHSVHHLGDAQASCAVAAGTAQLYGTAPSLVADGVVLSPAEPLSSCEPVRLTGTRRQPSQGRAPPLPA
jgi:hypothetical protein